MRRIAAVFLMCGCASALSPAFAERSCAPLPGWAEIAEASAGKYLILGEMHGTLEGVRAVQEYVCQIADGAVLLGVELPSSKDDALQKAWNAEPVAASSLRDALLEVFDKRLDGVGSQAMFDMMADVHALKQSGADIDIVAFNGARDDDQRARFAHLSSQNPHEAAQAENIRTAAQRRKYDHVVVLVGSAHAQKSEYGIGGDPFEPMAMKLAPSTEVISLRMETAGGTAWSCRLKPGAAIEGRRVTQDDVDCSAHAVGGRNQGPPMMAISPKGEGFDGYYAVGPVTASPPAVQ